MEKQISIIVAIADNWAIGKDNDLLWHISRDLKRFKEITRNHQVIMGRNTYLSLPFRPLKERTNIVITDDRNEIFEGCKMVYSIEEALELCSPDHESFIMGGASIYGQFLEYANKLYITWVNKVFEADTFFPEVDFSKWKLLEQTDVNDDPQNDFTYSFRTYTK